MKKLPLVLTAAMMAMTMQAAPLWLRDIKISPDGKSIAFTYKGDIFTVSSAGGKATRLTSGSSLAWAPVWSPDSKSIAFATDRAGASADIYIVPATGGAPRRLTSASMAETPEAFTPDGRYLLFSATLQDPATSVYFPSSRLTELYRIPVEGGRIEQVTGSPAQSVNYAPDGSFFLYHDLKGMENEWRKHHTSSVTRDVWRYDTATGRHTNLTARAGEDRNPVLSPDGTTVYMLSERDGGSFNVYSFPLDNPSAVTRVSNFSNHPVRFLSQDAGGMLAYGYDGEIYTQRPGAEPRKIEVEIVDDYINEPGRISVNSSSGAVASPDGKSVAFINRGDIFVTSVEYPTTRQITSTPAAESRITWGTDSRTLVYVSERDGHKTLYEATMGRADDPAFPSATVINERPLFDPADGVERNVPKFSPDGKRLAFVEGRKKLAVLDRASGKVTYLTDGSTKAECNGTMTYDWSPDGKWIALELTNNGHQPYTDIAIVNTTGKPEVTNITRTSYFDSDPVWSPDGNAIAFFTDRYGMRSHGSWGSQTDVMMVYLNRDAYDRARLSKEDYEQLKELEKQQKEAKKKATEADKSKKKDKKGKKEEKKDDDAEATDEQKPKVELDGIRDRLIRFTPRSGDVTSAAFDKKGETLYYIDDDELYSIDLRKRDVSDVASVASDAHLQTDAEGENIFILAPTSLKKMTISNEKIKPITYSAKMTLDRAGERAYMYDYVTKEAKERFYRKDMHGVDWDAYADHYRRFLPYINNSRDFSIMVSELLGELNCSHSGCRYRGTTASEPTSSLGLLYDFTWDGAGLKVAEVVAEGPFDHANSLVTPGTIVEKINGEIIDLDGAFTPLFNNLTGKKTLVSLYNPATGRRWDEVIKPISNGTLNDLLYRRWVNREAAMVDSLSGGRLGYVHIQSMGDDSFRKIYTDLFGTLLDKEGVIIDTRWNGGGRLHEDIEILFSGKKYLTQEIRGLDICDMPSRRWTKPSIMLQCEANYSNAHGTPWVYKKMGLGKLVGAPVPGTMSSVNWIDLQDPSVYFGVPVIGYRTAEGEYLENSQLDPDILVLNDPADAVNGFDAQLEAAVAELLKQLPTKK